jgi:flagellar biosynthesis protein
LKPKRAVALRYEHHKENAPRVVAKGAGDVAEAIIRAAEENRVPILEQSGLVDSLIALELDSVIPEELYQAVAEILAYVYQERIR